jgi:hypothetical protein
VLLAQGFFDTVRIELATSGIKVCMICPGPVVSQGAQNSFTENVDKVARRTGRADPERACSRPVQLSLTPCMQIVGEYSVDDSKKMPTKRCSDLICAALAHGFVAKRFDSCVCVQ